MYINGHNLCIGCMRPLDQEGGCSFCGLKQEEYSPIPRCLMPGTELAERYVTGKVLGEGSFGITYMGWDKYMDIPVAIKEYFPSDMVSRDVICGSDNSVYLYESGKKGDYHNYLKKFLGEARCLSRFNQVEGIVSVRDFFYANNTAYLVMQYIDGISVKEHIYKNGKMRAGEVLEKIRPVLLALEQVHNTGIVHRDISPDNLMIKKDGNLVLIDFGAARMRNIDNTKTMTVMFKRGFSPEEQYRYKGKWGAYTDVYSICATIYFMMTGTAPVDSVIRALGDDMPSLVTMKDLDIPARQRKALMKGLAVAAKNRWQNIGELYGALFEAGEHQSHSRKWKRRKGLAAAVLFFAVAGSIFGLVQFLQKDTKAEQVSNITSVGADSPESVSASAMQAEGQALTQAETTDQTLVPEEATEMEMPGVEGLDQEEAEEKLAGYGERIKVNWKKKYSEDVSKGKIISQSVAKGEKLPAGEEVELTLVVSRGIKKQTIPKLTGMSEKAARQKIKGKGFRCEIRRIESGEAEGTVVSQDIRAGKKMTKGTTITITVSKGRQTAPTSAPSVKPASAQGNKKNPKKGEDFAGTIR
ncbi:MAG: PASTA domain-containing protein [Roseburia sp.]|nr:PASTA domain-containing protein [Roseburia sp.]